MAACRNIREAAIFRSLILIGISGAFFAFALGYIPMDEQPPLFINILFGLFGALGIYGGLRQLRFVFKRRSALSGGRERKGTLQLRGKVDDDSTTALLTFSTAYGQWLIPLDPAKVRGREEELRAGVPARATVGEDEKVYALKIGSENIVLQSESMRFDGRMRIAVEKAEGWVAAQDAKQSG